jgi:hypothetical protein
MQITLQEIKDIEAAAFARGSEATMCEVERQIPDFLDMAMAAGVEAGKSARKSKPTKPYTNARRSARKPARVN